MSRSGVSVKLATHFGAVIWQDNQGVFQNEMKGPTPPPILPLGDSESEERRYQAPYFSISSSFLRQKKLKDSFIIQDSPVREQPKTGEVWRVRCSGRS